MHQAGVRISVAGLVAFVATACSSPTAMLTELVDARRLASQVHVEFTRAADASNRAVMTETDEAAAAAVAEARQSRQALERDLAELQAILTRLSFADDRAILDGFAERFAEYRRIDDEILPLAIENTNVKAQRLSFGPIRDAADAFRRAIDRARAVEAGDDWHATALALKASNALLQIQVLDAPHIAEADLEKMAQMEKEMTQDAAVARQVLGELRTILPTTAEPSLVEATTALDRFDAIHRELLAYSRRNSDVNSLALSLGEKRTVAAQCEERLRALDDALARHRFTATR